MTAKADELRVESREDGPTAHWVDVEIPAAQVDAAFARSYRILARSARVRGFRPGKAPLSYLKKTFGKSMMGEIVEMVSARGVEPRT